MKNLITLILSLIVFQLSYNQCSTVYNSSRGVNTASAANCNDQSVGNLDPYEGITFNVVAGENYRISINNINWNNESVSVFNNASTAFVGGASGGAGATYNWTSGFTGTVRAVATRNCINTGSYGWFNGMQSATLTYRKTGNGDPSVFGSNQWNVYCYSGQDWNLGAGLDYKGYYTESNLTFDSRGRWPDAGTPFDASGYLGCDPGIDNHTVVSKRRGFTPQFYSIDVTNHDDEAKLFVNGTEVWSHASCCDAHSCVWNGFLDASSTIEFRHGEGVGGSNQGLRFNELGNPSNFGVNQWNTYAYSGQNIDLSGITYFGYYTHSAIDFDTRTQWSGGINGTPATANGYLGCDPGVDNHTVVSKRQGFPCGHYELYSTYNDDVLRILVNGVNIHDDPAWDDDDVLVWSGVLDANSTIEVRHAEGVGGSGQAIELTNITTALNGGTISYSGSTTACAGYNPPAFGNSASASGGSSAAITNGSSIYQWQLDGNNIGGATNSTYDSGVLTTGTYIFRRRVTDKCGNVAYSNPVTLNVVADPSISTQPVDATICVGGSHTFTGAATGGTPSISYQWQYNNGGWSNVSNGTPLGATYSGVTSGSLGVSGILIPGDYDYRLVANASGNGCGAATSNAATLTVDATTIPGTATAANSPICVTGNTNISLGTHTGNIVRWETDDNLGFSSPTTIASTAATINSGTLTAGTHYFRAVVGSGTCPQLNSTPATVEVDATPSAAVAGTDQMACLSSTVTMDATDPAVGTGTWTWSPSAPSYENLTTANDNDAQVSFSTSGTYTGTWTVSNGACPSNTDDVEIKVNVPNPVVMSNATGTCTSNQVNGWVHIYNSTGNVIASINDNNQLLGDVTATVYYHGGSSFDVQTSSGACGTQAVLNRSFVINPTIFSHAGPVSVRLYFTDAELASLIDQSLSTQSTGGATSWGTHDPNGCQDDDDVLNINDLYVTQIGGASNEDGTFTAGDGTFELHTPTVSGIGNSTFGANYVQFDVNAFSEFWIHGSEHGVALPVELTKFEANAINNEYIELDWTTATEINNEGFEIERSTNGIEFSNIGFVNGNGNSTNIHNYEFKDAEVNKNITYYYRLKQVDYDGQFEYSNIVTAKLEGKENFTIGDIKPNPTKENTSVSTNISVGGEQAINVSIFNTIGMQISTRVINLESGTNKVEINTSNLSSGTYFINFEGSFGRETKKLVVVK